MPLAWARMVGLVSRFRGEGEEGHFQDVDALFFLSRKGEEQNFVLKTTLSLHRCFDILPCIVSVSKEVCTSQHWENMLHLPTCGVNFLLRKAQ